MSRTRNPRAAAAVQPTTMEGRRSLSRPNLSLGAISEEGEVSSAVSQATPATTTLASPVSSASTTTTTATSQGATASSSSSRDIYDSLASARSNASSRSNASNDATPTTPPAVVVSPRTITSAPPAPAEQAAAIAAAKPPMRRTASLSALYASRANTESYLPPKSSSVSLRTALALTSLPLDGIAERIDEAGETRDDGMKRSSVPGATK